jgi:hypothetical protein
VKELVESVDRDRARERILDARGLDRNLVRIVVPIVAAQGWILRAVGFTSSATGTREGGDRQSSRVRHAGKVKREPTGRLPALQNAVVVRINKSRSLQLNLSLGRDTRTATADEARIAIRIRSARWQTTVDNAQDCDNVVPP